MPKKNENLNHELEDFKNTIEFLITSSIILDDGFTHGRTFAKNGLMIAINGEWGTGKTFFLEWLINELRKTNDTEDDNKAYIHSWHYKYQRGTKQLVQYEKKDRHEVTIIEYNAWEDDYIKDPFTSIIGQICEQIRKNFNSTSQGILVDFLSTALELLPKPGKVILDLFKKTLSTADEQNHGNLNEIVTSYFNVKSKKDAFKSSLSKLGGEDKVKLIIIDELDRCQPEFAIKTLEILKHLFNAPNVVCIIAVCKKNLIESIKHTYGQGFDAGNYLSRFFDFELDLPTNEKFLQNLIDKKLENTEGISAHSIKDILPLFNQPLPARELLKYIHLITKLYEKRSQYQEISYLILMVKFQNTTKFKKIFDYKPEFKDTYNIEKEFKNFLHLFDIDVKNNLKLYDFNSPIRYCWHLFMIIVSTNGTAEQVEILKSHYLTKQPDGKYDDYYGEHHTPPQCRSIKQYLINLLSHMKT